VVFVGAGSGGNSLRLALNVSENGLQDSVVGNLSALVDKALKLKETRAVKA
jgi:hypothetical protein